MLLCQYILHFLLWMISPLGRNILLDMLKKLLSDSCQSTSGTASFFLLLRFWANNVSHKYLFCLFSVLNLAQLELQPDSKTKAKMCLFTFHRFSVSLHRITGFGWRRPLRSLGLTVNPVLQSPPLHLHIF